MTNKSQQERLGEVDKVLDEVRELLDLTSDNAQEHELLALQMLLRVTKELHTIHNVTDLITKVLDSAIAFAGADRAFLMLLDENGQPRFKMGRERQGNYLTIEEFSPSTGAIEEALSKQRTIIVPDAQNHAVYSKRDSVQEMSLRTIMCAPMMIKRQIIGLLYLDSRRNPLGQFNKSHINVLASLADQSAIAIVNAQKFETYTD
ncbi:MAG: GAF domain-containing protein [Anaerolineae bacterium]|nr:GAF domain-containing protein [Anaerolineae bacterium]